MTRRHFLRTTSAALLTARLRAQESALPPMRVITRGPGFHWFGYYDKFQFDPENRLVLGNEAGFEHRSPVAGDAIKVGMVDLHDGDRWTELGETSAWNWQQGCILQWLPGSQSEVMWNDREDGHFVCRILDVKSGARRTLPHAVYTVSPDGRWGLAPDFRRLNDCRPGYGYAGIPDPGRDAAAPDDAGIWKIDMRTGEAHLIITFAQIAAIPWEVEEGYAPNAKSWFNHLLFNQDGSRFIFLHRWRPADADPRGAFHTRMFTAKADGSDLYVIDPSGFSSHFVWRDPEHVFLFTWHPSHQQRFYLFKDRSREVTPIGPDVMTVNGHNTYLPGTHNDWVLNDTYPGKDNLQHVYLYHVPTNRRVPLADLESLPPYRGEYRCDTHPRSSRDGRLVCMDSPHAGGRQMYLIDLSRMEELAG